MLLDKQSGRSQINARLFLEREGKKETQLLIRGRWCGLVCVLQLSCVGCDQLLCCVRGGFGV